jgi:hypothetical protein
MKPVLRRRELVLRGEAVDHGMTATLSLQPTRPTRVDGYEPAPGTRVERVCVGNVQVFGDGLRGLSAWPTAGPGTCIVIDVVNVSGRRAKVAVTLSVTEAL